MKIELIMKINSECDEMVRKAIKRVFETHKDCSILNVAKNNDTIKVYIKHIECGFNNIMMTEYKIEKYAGFYDVYFQRVINKCKLMKF